MGDKLWVFNTVIYGKMYGVPLNSFEQCIFNDTNFLKVFFNHIYSII